MTTGGVVVIQELLTLKQVWNSKVARNNQAEEGQAAKDDVTLVEEDEDVHCVWHEGGHAEEEKYKWCKVSQFPVKPNKLLSSISYPILFNYDNWSLGDLFNSLVSVGIQKFEEVLIMI